MQDLPKICLFFLADFTEIHYNGSMMTGRAGFMHLDKRFFIFCLLYTSWYRRTAADTVNFMEKD
ncbi:hypothetical protein B5G00_10445 [Blautia sp. An46]|nr:hypothetical protein B5G33_12275 [Blautia sp. An81]OUN92099.1 hypothetical protein B5G00_10445 [Blautia sp. An46]